MLWTNSSGYILFTVEFCRRYLIIKKKTILKTYRFCPQTQDLQIFKKFYMSQMNPEEFVHNTAYSVQLPYIAGHSL